MCSSLRRAQARFASPDALLDDKCSGLRRAQARFASPDALLDGYRPKWNNRRLLPTTDTLDSAIAAAASIGDISPAAAMGIIATL